MRKPGPRTRAVGTRASSSRIAGMRRRFNERATIYHQRFLFDTCVVALLLFGMGCGWFTVLRWITLGALLMFLPKFFSDGSRLLDAELIRDRLGMKPAPRGRHSGPRSAPIHSGAHPRPGSRNKA